MEGAIMSNPLHVSEAVSLAFHAMVLLASSDGKTVSNRVIAEQFDASVAHLAKVMRRLTQAGMVDSYPGPSGGFVLAEAAECLTLKAIYEAIEGPLEPVKCLFGKPVCDGKCCVFGDELQEVDARLRNWLASTSLADVAETYLGETA
jgi:Rrf2 family protein